MRRSFTGNFEEPVRLAGDDELNVTGSVSDDSATVADSAKLYVTGSFAGSLEIFEGGYASITGNLVADVTVHAGGILLVAGNAIFDSLVREGGVGIAVGTLIDAEVVMQADGTTRPHRNGESLQVDASTSGYRFLQAEGPALSLAALEAQANISGSSK